MMPARRSQARASSASPQNHACVIAESEAVSPRVHVRAQPLATDTCKLVGEHHLQIAYGRLRQIIAARVAVEAARRSGVMQM
jgi:hypothetical protein